MRAATAASNELVGCRLRAVSLSLRPGRDSTRPHLLRWPRRAQPDQRMSGSAGDQRLRVFIPIKAKRTKPLDWKELSVIVILVPKLTLFDRIAVFSDLYRDNTAAEVAAFWTNVQCDTPTWCVSREFTEEKRANFHIDRNYVATQSRQEVVAVLLHDRQ